MWARGHDFQASSVIRRAVMRIGRYDDRRCGDAGSARMSFHLVDSNGGAIGPISYAPENYIA
jgi:hypothetical protein